MAVNSGMEPHVLKKARAILKNAAEELRRIRGILRDDRVGLRSIRVALEGEGRNGGLIAVLSNEDGDHWSVAEQLRGYGLTLQTVREPDMKKAVTYLEQARAVLQDGLPVKG